ncbi:hypothetical protein JCM16106_09450 [Hydrogenophilus islandicus]
MNHATPPPTDFHPRPPWSLLIIFLIAVALIAVAEAVWFRSAQKETEERLAAAAATQASAIDARVREHCENLTLIGKGLLAPYVTASPPRPIPEAIAVALARVTGEHPELRAVNVQSPDASRFLWSTLQQPHTPIFTADDFRPIDLSPAAEGTCQTTLPRFSPRFQEAVVGVRVPLLRADGTIAAFAGSPYRATLLFARAETLVPEELPPLRFTVTDRRFARVVALLDVAETLTFPDTPSASAPAATGGEEAAFTAEACRGAYCVTAAISHAAWRTAYAQSALPRWVLELGLLLILAALLSRQRTLLRTLHDALVQETVVARTDPLTQLINRHALEIAAPPLLADARRRGERAAVGILDLDDFKPVNDRYGHDAGDQLLRAVAERLQQSVRGGDLVARLGGDEFVILLTHLTPQTAEKELAAFGERLARAVAAPVPLADGVTVTPHYRVGWALFPKQGEELDALLRRADAALLTLKAEKGRSDTVMRVAGEEPEQTRWLEALEAPLDPFSPAAEQLLAAYAPLLREAAQTFAEVLLKSLTDHPEIGKRLAAQPAEELARYRQLIATHFATLATSDATRETIAEQAALLGTIHALEGLGFADAAIGYDRSHTFLQEFLNAQALRSGEVFRLLHLWRLRTALALQHFLAAMEGVQLAYLRMVLHEFPEGGGTLASWQEALAEAILGLPGIRMVLLLQPDAQGVFHLVTARGKGDLSPLNAAFAPERAPRLDTRDPAGRGLMATAWLRGTIATTDDYLHDPRTVPWQPVAAALGVASAAAVPLADSHGPRLLLYIGGRHPYQFSALFAQLWLQSVQARANAVLRAFETAPHRGGETPISVGRAAAIRAAVMSGGVALAVQPIVDLRRGTVVKAEALARLTVGSETLLPGQFLPALRADDYPYLFRAVVRQGLDWLRAWEQTGLTIDLSVNLDHTTLHQPDAANALRAALTAAGVAPERLTLELLEDEPITAQESIEALAALRAVGVKLAVDDLGSGYSGLLRLAELPFDVIKIDQLLVRKLAANPITFLTVIRALARLAEGLERQTVAEGVENAALAEALSVVGIPRAQGYAIARPMPPETLPAWAARWHQTPLLRYPAAPLTTLLGALTYQWQVHHERGFAHLQQLADCPVTAYLATYHPKAEVPRAAHAVLHDAVERGDRTAYRVAYNTLMEWFLTAWLREIGR